MNNIELVAYMKVINLEADFFKKFNLKNSTNNPSFGQDFPENDINIIVCAWEELKHIREKIADPDDYFAQGQIEFVSRKIEFWTSDLIDIDKIINLQESDIVTEYATKRFFEDNSTIWCGC